MALISSRAVAGLSTIMAKVPLRTTLRSSGSASTSRGAAPATSIADCANCALAKLSRLARPTGAAMRERNRLGVDIATIISDRTIPTSHSNSRELWRPQARLTSSILPPHRLNSRLAGGTGVAGNLAGEIGWRNDNGSKEKGGIRFRMPPVNLCCNYIVTAARPYWLRRWQPDHRPNTE